MPPSPPLLSHHHHLPSLQSVICSGGPAMLDRLASIYLSLPLSLSLLPALCVSGTATAGSGPLEEESGDCLLYSPSPDSTAELCTGVRGGSNSCHDNQEAGDRGNSTPSPPHHLTSSPHHPPPTQALKSLQESNMIQLPMWVWLDEKVGRATAYISHRSLVEAAYSLAWQAMRGRR